MRAALTTVYSKPRLADRVAEMGRTITRDYSGRNLDLVILLENAFIFASDLVRAIARPAVCHFVRVGMREVRLGGFDRREIFFSSHPNLEGRDVLLVDAVLHSGVLQDFLMKRLQDSRPRSLRLAVLLDKPRERKVDLKADYFGFVAASKYLEGYGLPVSHARYRYLPYVGLSPARAKQVRRSRSARKRKR